jgi:hypothetical protein
MTTVLHIPYRDAVIAMAASRTTTINAPSVSPVHTVTAVPMEVEGEEVDEEVMTAGELAGAVL